MHAFLRHLLAIYRSWAFAVAAGVSPAVCSFACHAASSRNLSGVAFFEDGSTLKLFENVKCLDRDAAC